MIFLNIVLFLCRDLNEIAPNENVTKAAMNLIQSQSIDNFSTFQNPALQKFWGFIEDVALNNKLCSQKR